MNAAEDRSSTQPRRHEITKNTIGFFRGFVVSWLHSKSRVKTSLLVLLAIPIVLVWARASSSQTDDLDVLKVIPENYKLIIDNQFVRVLEARIPAGTEEKPHRHLKGVSVCLTEYTLESRILPGGPWVRNERKVGTTYWSDASLHQVRNVGTTTSHTIRIELKY
jgi:hypothetical protein